MAGPGKYGQLEQPSSTCPLQSSSSLLSQSSGVTLAAQLTLAGPQSLDALSAARMQGRASWRQAPLPHVPAIGGVPVGNGLESPPQRHVASTASSLKPSQSKSNPSLQILARGWMVQALQLPSTRHDCVPVAQTPGSPPSPQVRRSPKRQRGSRAPASAESLASGTHESRLKSPTPANRRHPSRAPAHNPERAVKGVMKSVECPIPYCVPTRAFGIGGASGAARYRASVIDEQKDGIHAAGPYGRAVGLHANRRGCRCGVRIAKKSS